jgi:hypothetical protein
MDRVPDVNVLTSSTVVPTNLTLLIRIADCKFCQCRHLFTAFTILQARPAICGRKSYPTGENDMQSNVKDLHIAPRIAMLICLLMIATVLSFGQRGSTETIDATAFGTSTQLGRNVGIKVIIYEFSSPDDRDILVQAFQKGQNDGLVNALEKMKSVGRIQIPGTVGYDLSFIREIITPTGRTIRFVTNRRIAFGESYWNTQTKSFNLTAGEITLDDNDKSKSGGVLFPATQLIVNKEGELQFELNQNAWKLTNIIEWK